MISDYNFYSTNFTINRSFLWHVSRRDLDPTEKKFPSRRYGRSIEKKILPEQSDPRDISDDFGARLRCRFGRRTEALGSSLSTSRELDLAESGNLLREPIEPINPAPPGCIRFLLKVHLPLPLIAHPLNFAPQCRS